MALVSGSIMALKLLASQGLKKAAVETAKGVVKDKAKDFVTGKGRKKKGKRGKGGALVKSEGGQITQGGGQERGGALVPTTPMVGNYRVETPPQKPDEEGKPSKVSYETINNQLDSIIGMTEALKKTSMAKMKTANNRRKAERKSEEKAKQRNRESLLEKGAVGAIGAVGGAISKATPFDPLKFFTMIFLGSLVTWIMTHGSKVTAFLKMTLALMNNFGKLVKAGFTALKNVFKVGFNAIKKLGGPLVKVGKSLKTGLKSLGNKLFASLGRIGNGLKNLAKGVFNKIKAAGRILTSPIDALKGLTGAEKKAVKANKGLNKLLQQGGTASQNLGTATRAPGTLSNATRSMRLKHGDEAARMYQGLVDNGMKPSRAAQYVNKSIQSGKLTSAPLQGSLAGTKSGSQLFKGGVGRSTNRMIAKFGGKNALRATKALKKALGRIPIVGPLITLVVSLVSGEPLGQAMFKAGGAALGGFFGSFIPIPVVGTLFGEIVGEYVGDLMYVATMGGGVEKVGEKLKKDLTDALSMGQKAVEWVGNGFGRLYEGIPKIKIPIINKKFPDVGWMLSLGNIPEKLGLFHKAFFTDKPMEKGKEKTEETQETSGNVTNVSTVRRDTAGARYGDFIMASDGTLGVFDGRGTRGLKAGEQELFDSGATNIDGTRPISTSSSSSVSPSAAKWKPLLDLIAAGESDSSGGYDAMNPDRNTRAEGNPITEMTMRQVRDMAMVSPGGTGAAGRYQIMPEYNGVNVFKQLVEDVGLDYDTSLFSPENQDKMGVYRLAVTRRGNDWLAGKITNDAFGLGISMEWAALKSKSGGYYDHQKRNQSSIGYNRVLEAMNQIKTQSQQTPQSVQPQTPLVAAQKKTAVLAYGTNDWSLSESEIKKRATGMIRDLMSKGYNVVVVPPNKDLNVKGHGKKDAPYRGVYSAAAETGAVIELGKYQTGDTLHLEPADAKRIFNKYKSAIYVGDSNAVRMKASMSGDYSNTATAVSGARGDMIQQYIDSAVETQASRQATPDNSDQMSSQDQSTSSTLAQVTPSTQSQMSSGISGISRQLPYEEVGGTTILMSPGRGGSTMVGRTSAGTPVIVGSGDVVNSYYKSQLLGFLYKQG